MKHWKIEKPSNELTNLFSYREWRQRIHLEGDIYTPGTRCDYEWEMCSMPADLKGKSFLDAGANDGMFSFMAEEKGASMVQAVDLYVEEENTDLNMTEGWSIQRIRQVKALKRSKIQIDPCSIYELSKLNKQFDVVYCGNVIAWLQNPLEAIRQLALATKQTLIIREDISTIKGKPVLEYVNNKDLTGCMFNGNEAFYRDYLLALGFKNIRFIPVDEYRIFERRSEDFKKYEIVPGLKIYKNPFSDEQAGQQTESATATGSALVNGKIFFNHIGWILSEDVKPLPYSMIPSNQIKKRLFEKKYRKNMLQNYMIFAER